MNNGTENHLLKASENILSKAIFVIDTDGVIDWTNQAFRTLCGYSKVELVGKSVEEFFLEDRAELESVRALRVAVARGSHLTVDFLNQHKKGHPYKHSFEITPTKDKEGRFSGFIAVERDAEEECPEVAAIEQQVSKTYSALLSVEEKKRNIPSGSDSCHSQAY